MKKIIALSLLFSLIRANNDQNLPQEIERNRKHAQKLYYAIKSGDKTFMRQVLQESSVSQEEQLKLMLDIQEKAQPGISTLQLCKAAATFGLVSSVIAQVVHRIALAIRPVK